MSRTILLTILVFALAGCGDTGAERAAATEKSLAELRGAIERLAVEMKASEAKQTATMKAAAERLDAIERGLSEIQKNVQTLATLSGSDDGERVSESGADQELRRATLAEAEEMIKELGDKPTATKLADAIATMDEWLIDPAEEERFPKLKLEQLGRLRQIVKAEVEAHQKAALIASTGAVGAKEHAEAGRILSLFPMTDEAPVIDEAKQLAARQAEIANRLEVIRRQRYNRWAAEQIEKALDFYNANVSKWNPLNDNAILIGALVKDFGEVDPMVLEPAVLELYNYVIDRTKGSISEKNKLDLAKRLTDPSIRRKALGDF